VLSVEVWLLLFRFNPGKQFPEIVQLPGFVGKTLQEPGGLVDLVAAPRVPVAVGRFGECLHE
jgi:hypothetical protein